MTPAQKRIVAMLTLPNMYEAEKAIDALDAAGYEHNIRHNIVDEYSGAVFMEAWRYAAPDADELAAGSAILDELNKILDPFVGFADGAGVFAEGEPHDYFDCHPHERH